eukprot:CAMPEP_0202465878 /NCGR_PEP_ID=MMETSP1360-20130828/66964_1 /ASSEMBLY_ACC=CAM_ASM_000848 /TAXON_ID=515479 /ORGANISM="Licmophora paradoxa, Strain CCMP2313" /LENGTH=67 /DNA_ID=CAMNT_0049089805 /DNA_START=1 /DNA_END=204 /DNA_ORIENTATION=-
MGAVRSDEDLTFDHDESGADSQDDGIVHRLLTFPADQSQKEDEEEVVLKEVLKSANKHYLRQSSAGL